MTKQTMVHSTEAALRERVKELTCLYGISLLAQQPELSQEEVLQGVVDLLPPAWQYPDITSARIHLDHRSFITAGFKETPHRQCSQIRIGGRVRGTIEVCYAQEMPPYEEGPFLKEERNLIDGVARQVAFIAERRQAEKDKAELQDQLRHADRLATIGMLAAGVAHELNEPLGNVLGFAQLSAKTRGIPQSVKRDMQKITTESLHAREVITKLLVFARQTPPRKTRVDLNQAIEEGLFFFEARCAKAGVSLRRRLSAGLPEITADPSQLNQVLVNLVVNALQAMPGGGILTVQTEGKSNDVLLAIEDTGSGMSPEAKEKAFIPFFTTKDIGQGTGLGLPVVQGIVDSHGGSIEVISCAGKGTRFEIRLPVDIHPKEGAV